MAGAEPGADRVPPAPDNDVSGRVRRPVWRRAFSAIANHAFGAVVGVIVVGGGGALALKVGLTDPPKPSEPELFASLRVFTPEQYRQARRSGDIAQAANLRVPPGGRFALVARVVNRGEAPASNVEIFLRVDNGVTLTRAGCKFAEKVIPCPMTLSLLRPSVRLRKLQGGFFSAIAGTVSADAKVGTALRTDLTADSDNAPRSTDSAWVTVASPAQ
jgi:hypothetical protein